MNNQRIKLVSLGEWSLHGELMQTFKLLTGRENVNHDMFYSQYKQVQIAQQTFCTIMTSISSSHSLPSVDHCVGNMMLPSVTVYGVRGQSRYEVVVRVGSILFGKISAHPWCTGTIFGYSITQVSNRIFTIKCRQSSSATATHLATSLTVSIHS